MSRLLPCLVALCLAPSSAFSQDIGVSIGGGVVQANGQPPRDARLATGHAAIRGRVLASDGGQPMRRATVRVSAPELRVARTAFTDPDGRYDFRDLPAGRYSINASKPAFVSWSYGQTRPNGPGTTIALSDTQTADNVDVRLSRGAVITGRVIDEYGEPMPERLGHGAETSVSTGAESPDPVRRTCAGERHRRVPDLRPGSGPVLRVIDSAGVDAGHARRQLGRGVGTEQRLCADLLPRDVRRGVRAEAHGGGGADAERRRHRADADAPGHDHRQRGRLGGPPDGGIRLRDPRGYGVGIGLGGVGGPIRQDGTFTIPNVPPGEYVLRANAARNGGVVNGPPDFSVADVIVTGDDVSGVRLAPRALITISGHISFDDPSAAQPLKPSTIRVVAQAVNPDDFAGIGVGAGGPPKPVKDDFTFELKTAPGRIALAAIIQQAGPTHGG